MRMNEMREEDIMGSIAEGANGVWLGLNKYNIVSLKPELESLTDDLDRLLSEGVIAVPDRTRDGFYDVKVGNSWLYLHVRDENRTVYLVAALPTPRQPRPSTRTEAIESGKPHRRRCSDWSPQQHGADPPPALAPCCR